MTDSMSHRGPDGEGYLIRPSCLLGFRRLSIMDPEAPSRPFSDESGTVFSVANAEIYNARELRKGLEDKGHRLTTNVDTEVIPHLWEEHGASFVSRLRGMFAVAVWDEPNETLVLARDRAGEKPLFYWEGDNGTLIFASELRALLAHPRIEPVIDPVALRRYLLHGFFPAPFTPFSGIRKLPASHILIASPEDTVTHRYWDLAPHFENEDLRNRSERSLAIELDSQISSAVSRRRISDVPIGLFLSGGLDSSTILAHLAEQAGPGVPVFAIGHTDEEFDESEYARDTARHFGADFHRVVLDESDLARGLRQVADGFDEPLGDASTIPTHLLALYAREHVKVVLSGEGADELFGGYPTYLGHEIAGVYSRIPSPLRRMILAIARRVPATMGNVDPASLFAASPPVRSGTR